MGDEWPSAALFWLDHTRDAATVLLDEGLDHVRAAPTVSALLLTSVIVFSLWLWAASRAREAARDLATRRSELSVLADACANEKKWRIASANVEARARNTVTVAGEPVTVAEEQSPTPAGEQRPAGPGAGGTPSPQTTAAA